MFTILFGVSEFLPKNQIVAAAVMVVAMDALMSFFGSMGNDAAFSSWTTDLSNDQNRGQIGAVLAALPIIATIVGTVVSGILIAALDYFVFFIITFKFTINIFLKIFKLIFFFHIRLFN